MDDENRQAFAALMKEIHGVSADVRANTSLTADMSRSISEIKVEQGAIRGEVKVLQKAVFGSEPPPAPPLEPITRQVSEHGGEIAHLTGQVIAARAEVAEMRKEAVEKKDLGLDAAGFWAFVRKAEVKDLVKLFTLIAAIIAAAKGLL